MLKFKTLAKKSVYFSLYRRGQWVSQTRTSPMHKQSSWEWGTFKILTN